MKKAERFFGLHFDFHASNEDEIGLRTNPEDIEWYIKETRPDFVQADCKGHPGNASYPSKLGNGADKLKADNLKIWCETVKKNGLPFFVHYSGVLDGRYIEAHPEAAARDEEGNVIPLTTSVFSDYVDKCLIPQLKELITEYGIDGAWIDGECWAMKRDFSDNAKPYLKPGITVEEHNAVMRKGFLDYVKHYVDEIHKFAPDFKITSNWIYSSYILQKPEIGVDFLSGDYAPSNSVHEARFESRCLALQNMPWDLMAWSFYLDPETRTLTEKSAAQLKQEAAMVLSLGGGFQLYIAQNSDGSARVSKSTRYREVADFVHERRLNFKKKQKAQVGILYSAESKYKGSDVFNPIFNPEGTQDHFIGMLNCVLDSQYTVNIIAEYQTGNISEYDIVIAPQWEYMSEKTINDLLFYAENGGNLIVSGANLSAQIGKMCGYKFGGTVSDYMWSLFDEDEKFVQSKGRFTDLIDGDDFTRTNNDMRDIGKPSYLTKKYGSGKLVFIPFDLGSLYFKHPNFILNGFIKKIMTKLCAPNFKINKNNIDITYQEGGDCRLINLINMNQSRHDLRFGIYDEVTPIYDVEVEFKSFGGKISMPLGEEFEYEENGESVVIKLDRLDIHSIIKIEK